MFLLQYKLLIFVNW